MEAAGDDEHVLLERGRDRCLGDGSLLELDGDHRTEPTDLPDPRMRAKRDELVGHDLAERLGARDEPLIADDLERRQTGGTRHWVPAERRAVRPGAPALHPLACRDDGAERQAAAECFGERHDVGRHVDLLRREPRAGAAHPCLDLVEDKERADPRGELAQGAQE